MRIKWLLLIPLVLLGTGTITAVLLGFLLFEDNSAIVVINVNWNLNFSTNCEEILYKHSDLSPNGDGEIYSVIYMEKAELEKANIDWKKGKSDAMETEIIALLKMIGVDAADYPPFDKTYQYTILRRDDNSKAYILYVPSLQRLYVIEDIL